MFAVLCVCAVEGGGGIGAALEKGHVSANLAAGYERSQQSTRAELAWGMQATRLHECALYIFLSVCPSRCRCYGKNKEEGEGRGL